MTYKMKAAAAFVALVCVEILLVLVGLPATLDGVFNTLVGYTTQHPWHPHQMSTLRVKQAERWLAGRGARVRVKEVDCSKLFLGDRAELKRAKALELHKTVLPKDVHVQRAASDCQPFLRDHGFILDPLTRVESNFPIAYSILVYKQASQVVDLLSAIYRPQNLYCVHVDKKVLPGFRHAMEAVTRCLPNVFLASRSVDVTWGNFTVLEPELVCMEDLWANRTWKYFINLTGQEFPLKTNYELVRILTALKGANDVAASVPNPSTRRYRWQEFLPAPHNITLYKGSVHVALSRGFVDYVLHAAPARAFLQWCRLTRHPDEHFFNSLNTNPHLAAPGSYRGKVNSSAVFRTRVKPFLSRYKTWLYKPSPLCPGGRAVRQICILSVLELPLLHEQRQLFANKFYADYSRLALRCLAEELHNRTREQTVGRMDFDVSYYEQLPFLKDTF